MKKDYAAIALQYAQDVVAGIIPACKWTRLACQRQLNDLARAAIGWIYEFNPELDDLADPENPKKYRPGSRICGFIELMPHVKGDWAGRRERIRLEPWQIFILCVAFGWVNRETKKRRFTMLDLFVPRKNAKSTKAAGIGNFMLAADGEFGAEIYSGATSEDQAREVFRPAFLMARASPEYCSRYGVYVPSALNPSNMSVMDTNSKFEPIIGDPGDGASPSCAIVDEYHEHKTSNLYDTMRTGMGARSQPMMVMITTSGDNVGGPCYLHQQELQKILEGVIENEQRFGIIYGIDETDDWTTVEALIKANPNYGVSINAEFLRAQQLEAIADAQKQNTFKTKHLNVWVGAASPWLNLEKLQALGDPTLCLEGFKGEVCDHGLDLASKEDIASDVMLFRREIEGLSHYYAFSKNYVPEEAVKDPKKKVYQGWVANGHITQTAGNMININQIGEDVEATAENHVIHEIAIDEWGAAAIAPDLQEKGFTVVSVPMNVKHLSEPMKNIRALVNGGRFHHDGNPAYVWMLSNVECFEDRNENIFPRKGGPAKKIDAAIATIVAMSRCYVADSTSVYEERGVLAL